MQILDRVENAIVGAQIQVQGGMPDGSEIDQCGSSMIQQGVSTFYRRIGRRSEPFHKLMIVEHCKP
jgi:hypothetical protein